MKSERTEELTNKNQPIISIHLTIPEVFCLYGKLSHHPSEIPTLVRWDFIIPVVLRGRWNLTSQHRVWQVRCSSSYKQALSFSKKRLSMFIFMGLNQYMKRHMTISSLYPCSKLCSRGTHNETVKTLALFSSIINGIMMESRLRISIPWECFQFFN